MLTLTRRIGERIAIGDDIEITVVGFDRGRVRLGVRAPAAVTVRRGELLDRAGEAIHEALCRDIVSAANASLRISLQDGLFGMREHREFLLCETGSSVRALVSCRDPLIQLRVLGLEDYAQAFPREAAATVAGIELEDAAVALVVRRGRQPAEWLVNEFAPIVIDVQSRRGRQIVLDDPALEVARPVLVASHGSPDGQSGVASV